MHGQRWREFDGYETKGLSEEAASLRRQLQDAKAAARSAIERLETEAMQRQHAEAKVSPWTGCLPTGSKHHACYCSEAQRRQEQTPLSLQKDNTA